MHCSECLCRQCPLTLSPATFSASLGGSKLCMVSSGSREKSLSFHHPMAALVSTPRSSGALLQHLAVSHPSTMGSPPLLIPPRASPCPKGRSQDVANSSLSPAAQVGIFYQSKMSNMTLCRNQTPLFPFPAPLYSWSSTGRLKSPWLLCDKGQVISLWEERELMIPSPSNWGW